MNEPNVLAYLALLLVIPATFILFSNLPMHRAVLVLMVGGIMFLPSRINFDPPLIPPLDKYSIPSLCMLVAVFSKAGRKVWANRPPAIFLLLMAIMLVGAFGTTATNTDAMRFAKTRLQALTSSDTISELVSLMLGPIAHFVLGAAIFRTAEDAKDFLRAFVLGALVYLPFVLVELRLSPQFHLWVYGFAPSVFGQTVREAGVYRPQVFMNHGLTLAMFIATGMMGSWTLARAGVRLGRYSMKPFAWVITGLLSIIHSLGALIYGIFVAPAIRYLKPSTQVTIAAALSFLVLGYPLLRSADMIPVEDLLELSGRYSDDRAESLGFRFKNEDLLLRRALERPVFGWGGWGRNRVYDEESGRDLTVTDGLWVIHLGSGGYVRFFCEYGLMLLPLFRARRKIGKLDREGQILLGGISLISIVHTVDLLPNAGCGYFFLFLPGVLTGLTEGMSAGGARRLDPQTILRALVLLRRAGMMPTPPRPEAPRPTALT